MPQFDTVTFFNQIFWFLITFLGFYFIVVKALLPVVALSLKTRKKLMNHIFSVGGGNAENFFKKPFFKSVQKGCKTNKTLSFSLDQNNLSSFISSLARSFSRRICSW